MDGLGNPVHLQLTGGNVHDSTVSVDVLSHLDLSIPPKSNTRNPWRCDWALYKERHLVECFFLKLKQFRRVATRYDKLASSFLAFVYLASIAILLK